MLLLPDMESSSSMYPNSSVHHRIRSETNLLMVEPVQAKHAAISSK